jgi:putative copper resistance protein D
MALDLQTVQRIDTALVNLAVAVLTGAAVARLRLERDASGWAAARLQPVRTAARAAAVVALLANLATLWLESAAMAEVPVMEAGGATWAMLTSTHLGVAWSIGMFALTTAAAAGTPRLILCALAVFWYTRGMVSHAASDGDFSLRLVADWVHLGLISLWVGEVAVAGVIAMQAAPVMTPDDRGARAAYVRSLSNSATFALAGIVVTGLYAAWRNVGGWADLSGTPYGQTLVAKLLVVGIAAALGGFNRFVVMPAWLARESAGEAAPAFLPARFRHVLWIEGCVLLAAVVLAAWLASTSPPVEPM